MNIRFAGIDNIVFT